MLLLGHVRLFLAYVCVLDEYRRSKAPGWGCRYKALIKLTPRAHATKEQRFKTIVPTISTSSNMARTTKHQ